MMATQSAALNATRRRAEMAQLADGQRVDVAVIGGGITGAGVALDAASRGMSTVLLERCDLANGTSRSFETTGQGTFTLEAVPYGRYRLELSRTGFANQSRQLSQAGHSSPG